MDRVGGGSGPYLATWEASVRVLVTGREGYIGSLPVPFLQAADLEVVGSVDA
jgi:hypothetical protein